MKSYDKTPKVGIVLVNYNGEKFQNDCIRTLKAMSYANYEIIVVDNGSKDNSISMLKKKYNDVTIIETGENNGVAKGNNIGINYALENDCEYILILNNDTEVHEKMLDFLVENSNEDTITVPKIYYYSPSDKLWFAGGKIEWNKGTVQHFGDGEIDKGQYDEKQIIEYSPTCCFLVHKSVFHKIGFMDEKYFMYYDDVDFCVRLLENNYKILYVPEALVWHKVSSSSGGSESLISIYYGTRNRLYFINKFYKNKTIVLMYTFSTRCIRIIQYLLKGKFKKAKMVITSIAHYNKGKMGRL